METAWVFVFINVWIVSCQENESSTDNVKKPGLIPGEELLNTFLQTENNDPSDVPKDLEILKGWIYKDNSPEQNKGEKEELKVRKKRHLLRCKILGQCGDSGGGGYGGGGGGTGLLLNIGLPTINIGFPASSQFCNTCPAIQQQPLEDPCKYGDCVSSALPPNPCPSGNCAQAAPQYSPRNPCDYDRCTPHEPPPPPPPPINPIPWPVPSHPQPDPCAYRNCDSPVPPPPPPQKHSSCDYGPCPQPTPPPPPSPYPCASGGCAEVKQPTTCSICGIPHFVTYSHAESTSYGGTWRRR